MSTHAFANAEYMHVSYTPNAAARYKPAKNDRVRLVKRPTQCGKVTDATGLRSAMVLWDGFEDRGPMPCDYDQLAPERVEITPLKIEAPKPPRVREIREKVQVIREVKPPREPKPKRERIITEKLGRPKQPFLLRDCEKCGNPMKRETRRDGSLERPNQYARRKFHAECRTEGRWVHNRIPDDVRAAMRADYLAGMTQAAVCVKYGHAKKAVQAILAGLHRPKEVEAKMPRRYRNRTPDHILEQVAPLYKSGLGTRAISKRLQISRTTVQRIVGDAGIETRGASATTLSESQIAEVQRKAREGATYPMLAAEYGVGLVTIWRYVKRTKGATA